MNTIPTVGPDTAIAPRTGSGSPQTPAQQRADAAPSVLSDSPAAAADPGVTLKITPPVQARQGDSKVSEQGASRALSEWASLISDPDVIQIAALTGSAKEADEAIQNRVAQAFAALPAEVQEAIRLASTPAIANLLRLAAITASGIKEAPAVLQTGTAPMGGEVFEAIDAFRQVLQQAPPFKLAQLLQELAGLRTPQIRGSDLGSGTFPGEHTISNDLLYQSQKLFNTQPQLGQAGAELHAVRAALSKSQNDLAEFVSEDLSLSIPKHSNQVEPQLFQGKMGQLAGSINAQANGGSLADVDMPNSLSPSGGGGGAQGQIASSSIQGGINNGIPIANHGSLADNTEAAIRDGLRLLMDGRMLWQGQFTPGVPLHFERSDAWRTNRRSLGGMDKGTSLKVKLELPNIGVLEVRAMGFGAQVSVRLHTDPETAPTVASALPELQVRLRDRGLAGAQVIVDSL